MKMYWGSGGITPRILDLGTRSMWVVSFTPRPLYSQGRNPWYPLDRRLGGPQSRSGRGGEEKNSQPPPGLETPRIMGRPVRKWSLYQLNYPGSELRCVRIKFVGKLTKWMSSMIDRSGGKVFAIQRSLLPVKSSKQWPGQRHARLLLESNAGKSSFYRG
jgi:hypothetical protein